MLDFRPRMLVLIVDVWFAPERTFVLARGPGLVCQQSIGERHLFRPETPTPTYHILSFAI